MPRAISRVAADRRRYHCQRAQAAQHQENEAVKADETPEGWEQKPSKNAQKDKDAR
jgi:hypothetical protein